MKKKKVSLVCNSFAMVAEFHRLAGHPITDTEDAVAVTPGIKVVRFREHFKLEEIIEGLEALSHKDSLTAQRTIELLKRAQAKWNEMQPNDLDVDMVEYADSLGDLKYITDGAAHCYNIDLNKVVEEVHVKNLTRFPANETELQATLEKAKREGLDVYHENAEGGRFVVKRVDNNKVYKNAMFLLPELAPILGIKR
jgi:predicted HAD superfamily Cof-like phosphohydrolase